MKPRFSSSKTKIVIRLPKEDAEKERFEKCLVGTELEGAGLRKIQASNDGHDPLWPEDQYQRGEK